MQPIVWNIKELVELFDKRRINEYDVNFLVTGGTGRGKSTIIFKILSRFKEFKQRKHQVYNRSDTISLLRDQKFSICWNDELISAGYKRQHYEKEQIDLIGTLTKYRCNFNIFAGALPVFFTLDKELLKLFCINIDVIKRGFAVIHMRKEGRRYTDDPWDTKHNAKLEEKWSMSRQINPNFNIPYHKYSTFVGYLYWNDWTPKQERIYEQIRDEKKKAIEDEKDVENNPSNNTFYDKLLEMTVKKELNNDILKNICLLNNKNIVSVRARLNQMLRLKGVNDRVKDLVKPPMIVDAERERILNELKDVET